MKHTKQKKALALSTQTIRKLHDQELEGAAGGFELSYPFDGCTPTKAGPSCKLKCPM